MKPILFNTEMVRAILEGRKTCTRRVVKFRLGWNPTWSGYVPDGPALYGSNNIPAAKAPYCSGDILYVPEAWKCSGTFGELGYEVEFRDGHRIKFQFEDRCRAKKWAKYRDKPSHQWQSPYFMPREAARLFLRVKNVRAERLQRIKDDDLKREGVPWGDTPWPMVNYFKFGKIWDSTIKKTDLPIYGFDANPWVWVIEFERISKEETLKGGNENA